MKKYKGSVQTWIHGSDCDFEFEVSEDATTEEIEAAAKEAAMEFVEWSFWEYSPSC